MTEYARVPVDFLRKVGRLAEDERWPERFPKIWSVLEAMLAAAPQDDELVRLEREIAESSARTEFAQEAAFHYRVYSKGGWVDCQICDPDANWLHYLDLRGLLERHPNIPNLVKLKETQNDD